MAFKALKDFQLVETGGGCTALQHNILDYEIVVTEEDTCDAPTNSTERFTIGLHTQYDYLYHLNCSKQDLPRYILMFRFESLVLSFPLIYSYMFEHMWQ